MPRISDFAILRLPEQPVLRIRRQTAPAALPEVISTGYARLAAHLHALGGRLSDAPFVVYGQSLAVTEAPLPEGCAAAAGEVAVELCFPLAAPVPGQGEVECATLAARDVVFCMVLGPYDAIGPVYEEMAAWIQAKGYAAPQASGECYYNGQGYPAEHLLTKLMMPLTRLEA